MITVETESYCANCMEFNAEQHNINISDIVIYCSNRKRCRYLYNHIRKSISEKDDGEWTPDEDLGAIFIPVEN